MFDSSLVTVWSAPNYCYRCGNVASILQINSVDNRTPKLFEVWTAFSLYRTILYCTISCRTVPYYTDT